MLATTCLRFSLCLLIYVLISSSFIVLRGLPIHRARSMRSDQHFVGYLILSCRRSAPQKLSKKCRAFASRAATMPQEVLLTTSSSADSSILLHDLHTSNHIQSFPQPTTARNGLTLSPRQFLAAQVDKGTLHVYSWGKDAVDMKMILPEKIRSLKMSPSGTWCAGGSESGRLFVWEVTS